jgi:hypothetical protein
VRQLGLTAQSRAAKITVTYGVVAQLGERCNRTAEVVSSILIGSTTKIDGHKRRGKCVRRDLKGVRLLRWSPVLRPNALPSIKFAGPNLIAREAAFVQRHQFCFRHFHEASTFDIQDMVS